MVSASKFQSISPGDFEHLVADIWAAKGFDTSVRSISGDRGVDVEAVNQVGYKEIIQAKRYSAGNKVGSNLVRKYATLYQQIPDANKVVIVTTSEFTLEAERLASDLEVKIIDKYGLADMVNEYNMENILDDYLSYDTNIRGKSIDAGNLENDINKTESPFSGTGKYYNNTKKTRDLGKVCPICGSEESIWSTVHDNTGKQYRCKECDTIWRKKPKFWGIFGEGWKAQYAPLFKRKNLSKEKWRQIAENKMSKKN